MPPGRRLVTPARQESGGAEGAAKMQEGSDQALISSKARSATATAVPAVGQPA
jgi:hypothetical protein